MTVPTETAILDWIKRQPGPVLFSAVREEFGRWNPTHVAFNALIRDKVVEATFPEAKPGDSGRQFWKVVE